MVAVGTMYSESRPDLPRSFCVTEVRADGFTAVCSHMVVGTLATHRFDPDGRFTGYVTDAGAVVPGRDWGANLVLAHALPLSAAEAAERDALFEAAPDHSWDDFAWRYEAFYRACYTARDPDWVPGCAMLPWEFGHAGRIHRRRVVEALNAGRRVSYWAMADYPDLFAQVKGRTVRNGGYVFKSLDWEPLTHGERDGL